MAVPSISQRYKFDVGLIGQTINNNNATGPYYDMGGFRKAVAVVLDGANAINKATKVEFLQATAAAGTGAKVVKQGNASAGTESSATATVAALTLTASTECTVTLASAANADTVTINGITYTAHTDTTTAADREFKIDGDDTADATELKNLINDATVGVPGVTATSALGVITLKSTDAGATAITVTTSNVGRIAPASTQSVLYCEIDSNDLDIAGGFRWVAVKVTKAGNGIVAATLVREVGDYGPVSQAVAASTLI
jgi:hypothetical protein